jgi:hypothetical protein
MCSLGCTGSGGRVESPKDVPVMHPLSTLGQLWPGRREAWPTLHGVCAAQCDFLLALAACGEGTRRSKCCICVNLRAPPWLEGELGKGAGQSTCTYWRRTEAFTCLCLPCVLKVGEGCTFPRGPPRGCQALGVLLHRRPGKGQGVLADSVTAVRGRCSRGRLRPGHLHRDP